MNHKNKQIYSNREGANGSHRIDDHLRVSAIKTAHRRPLNNSTAIYKDFDQQFLSNAIKRQTQSAVTGRTVL